jgi:hypothetical protein
VIVQIYNMYNYDLRHLFTVEPLEVLQRFCSCFVPGRHASLLQTPDLYGPVVAVVSLPQVSQPGPPPPPPPPPPPTHTAPS